MSKQKMGFCGAPRTGIHSYRIFDFAVVDIVLSLLLAALITYGTKLSFWFSIPLVFATGIIVHRALGIETKLNSIIFGN